MIIRALGLCSPLGTWLETNAVRGTVAMAGSGHHNSLLYTPPTGFIGQDHLPLGNF